MVDTLSTLYKKQRLKKSTSTSPPFSSLPFYKYLKEDLDEFVLFPLTPKALHCEYSIHFIGDVESISFIVESYCKENNLHLLSEFIGERKDVRTLFRNSELVDNPLIYIENINTLKDDGVLFELRRELRARKRKCIVLGSSLTEVEPSIKSLLSTTLYLKSPSVQERVLMVEYLSEKYKCTVSKKELIASNTPGHTLHTLEQYFRRAQYKYCTTGYCMEEYIVSLLCIKEGISFDSIGALKGLKNILNLSILLPAKYPEYFKRIGLGKPSGLLLYGPPGCGKTLIAKALASQLHCTFISIRGPELINKYVGDSEKYLRDIFLRARNSQPAIVFFDEIDSFARDRNLEGPFNGRLVNQLLTLMDGVEDRGQVYIVGATNKIHLIDRALLRPGRFDKCIEVPLPSKEERVEIFNKLIGNIVIGDIDFSQLETDGFSGADINGLIKEAALICIENTSGTLREEDFILQQVHFIEAINRINKL